MMPTLYVIPSEARNPTFRVVPKLKRGSLPLGTMLCIGFLVAYAPRNDHGGAFFKGTFTSTKARLPMVHKKERA